MDFTMFPPHRLYYCTNSEQCGHLNDFRHHNDKKHMAIPHIALLHALTADVSITHDLKQTSDESNYVFN